MAELVCCQCGYVLAGLARQGMCPECGLAIAESLAAGESVALREAYRRLARGAWLAGPGGMVLGMCAGASLGGGVSWAAVYGLIVPAALAWCGGWFVMGSARAEEVVTGGRGARLAILGCVLAQAAAGAVALISLHTPRGGSVGGPLVVMLAVIGGGLSVVTLWVVGFTWVGALIDRRAAGVGQACGGAAALAVFVVLFGMALWPLGLILGFALEMLVGGAVLIGVARVAGPRT